MTVLESIVLGAIQGLTEFIPVSSSGHLVLAENILGIETPHVFSILVNLGTFLALVIHFRSRLIEMFRAILKEKNYKLARNLFISTVPVVVIGFLFEDFFEQSLIQNPIIVAVMLFLVGIFMVLLDKLPKSKPLKNMEGMSIKKAGIVGFAQSLALIPGTSRSGATMIAGRLIGLDYRKAAEYSFLLSIPLMFGVLLKGLLSSEGVAFINSNLAAFIISNIMAFITGILAVKFMLEYLSRGNFAFFGWYRLCLACLVVVVILL